MAAHEGDWKWGMCPEDGAWPPTDLPVPGRLKGKEERRARAAQSKHHESLSDYPSKTES